MTPKVRAFRARKDGAYGDVHVLTTALLPRSRTVTGSVMVEDSQLPVFHTCDVLVAGGGTSGAPAALAAAGKGMKTVLVEYHHALGGVSTVGVLGKYYYGNHCGFTEAMETPVAEMAANINQGKAEWYRRECRKRGVVLLMGSMVCGVTLADNKVTGAVVVLPDGRRGVIRAEIVIDATGNADVAAAAGETTAFISGRELSLQGTSLNSRPLGSNTINSDVTFCDETDAWGIDFVNRRLRTSLAWTEWDHAQLVGSRERRHIKGVYTISPVDVLDWEDNFPIPEHELKAVVVSLPHRGGDGRLGYSGVSKLYSNPVLARKLLKEAYRKVENGDAKTMYAATLALLGDRSGVPTLIKALDDAPEWDKGWQWSARHVYVRKNSYLDGYIIMLGLLQEKAALPVILDKARALTAESAYSHFRAIAISCEAIGDAKAAPVLAALLQLPGMTGHHKSFPPKASFSALKGLSLRNGDHERCVALRELSLVRALYNLGDVDGMGEGILRKYTEDPRSPYARHAMLVLSAGRADD